MHQLQQDLHRNSGTVAAYAVCTAAVLTFFRANRAATAALVEEGSDPSFALNLYLFVCLLAATLALSALQALFFARLGARLDCPIWRRSEPRTALREFLPLWFVINLAVTTLLSVLGPAAMTGPGPSAGLLFLVSCLVVCVATPAGAAVMFHAASGPQAPREGAACVLRNLPSFVPALFIGLLQWVSGDVFQAAFPPDNAVNIALLGVCDLPLAVAECAVLALAWRVCMADRDRTEEEEDALDDDDY